MARDTMLFRRGDKGLATVVTCKLCPGRTFRLNGGSLVQHAWRHIRDDDAEQFQGVFTPAEYRFRLTARGMQREAFGSLNGANDGTQKVENAAAHAKRLPRGDTESPGSGAEHSPKERQDRGAKAGGRDRALEGTSSRRANTEAVIAAARRVVAFWDSLDAVALNDPQPTVNFALDMDGRIDSLRSALDAVSQVH